MADRDRFGLRGSVKLCETHRTWYSRGCEPSVCETEERSHVTTVEFRPDGSLERHWQKNPPPNSLEWTYFYEYRDDNQLAAMRFEQGSSVTFARRYEYDSAARLSHIIALDKEGNPRVAETYSYEAGERRKSSISIRSCPLDSADPPAAAESRSESREQTWRMVLREQPALQVITTNVVARSNTFSITTAGS